MGTTTAKKWAGMAGGAVLVAGLMTAGAGLAAAGTPSGDGYTVIASGLNNPRHLSIGARGALYVAESGTGGDGPCITSSDGSFVCYGPTGSITEVTHTRRGWSQHRVVKGLPSLAPPATFYPPQAAPVIKGGSAIGPSDVEVLGNRYVASIGLGAPPADRNKGKATDQTKTESRTLPRGFGDLITGSTRPSLFCRFFPRIRYCSTDHWRTVADIAAFEQRDNPVDGPDSNPASVQRQGAHVLVADAGGNTALSVNGRGHVSLVAAFPDTTVDSIPMQFVPTSVISGPGHAYYVSQLTGYPFPPGGAAIWKVSPARGHHAATVSEYATGLTNVTDLAFAPNGDLYVVEISSTGLATPPPAGPPDPYSTGAVLRIPRGGGTPIVVASGLEAPYGIALHGHDAYVTTGSTLPGGGQVIQIPLGR